MKLLQYLIGSGEFSRRQAFDLIRKGAIVVNGQREREPSRLIDPENDRVMTQGRAIITREPAHYYMLNKPVGFLCTHNDPKSSAPKAVHLIPCAGIKLAAAGRLDLESDGMLLFSDDGSYLHRVAHPSFKVLKCYEVVLDRDLSLNELTRLKRGINDHGEFLKPRTIARLNRNLYLFILNEGRKREIRRLAASANTKVLRLTRVATGNLEMRPLPNGQCRELNASEIAASLQAETVPERYRRFLPEKGNKR